MSIEVGQAGSLIMVSTRAALVVLSLCLLSLGHMIAHLVRQIDGVLAEMNKQAAMVL